MDLILLSKISFILVVIYLYIKTYRFLVKERYKLQGYALIKGLLINSVTLFLVFISPRIFDIESFDIEIIVYIIIGFLIIWIIAISDYNPSRMIFKAENANNASNLEIMVGLKKVKYKNVSQFSNQNFPTYPRFTVHMVENNDKGVETKMIFDSSDYDEINQAFGISDEEKRSEFYGNCQSFRKGMVINYHGIEYKVEDVYFDVLDFFDDYSTTKSQLHKGEDTPYNIQLHVYIKEIL